MADAAFERDLQHALHLEAAARAIEVNRTMEALVAADAAAEASAAEKERRRMAKAKKKHESRAKASAARRSLSAASSTDAAPPLAIHEPLSVNAGSTTDTAPPDKSPEPQSVNAGTTTDSAPPAKSHEPQSDNAGGTTDTVPPAKSWKPQSMSVKLGSTAVQNLQHRFPAAAEANIVDLLVKHGGHAGRAARELAGRPEVAPCLTLYSWNGSDISLGAFSAAFISVLQRPPDECRRIIQGWIDEGMDVNQTLEGVKFGERILEDLSLAKACCLPGYQNADALEVLLAAGASVSDEMLMDSLELEIELSPSKSLASGASEPSSLDCMALLLVARATYSFQTCSCLDHVTPLHLACQNGELNLVRLLIEGQAPVNSAKSNGSTPLYKAAQGNFVSIVRILIDARADVDAQFASGATALFAAAMGAFIAPSILLGSAKPCLALRGVLILACSIHRGVRRLRGGVTSGRRRCERPLQT